MTNVECAKFRGSRSIVGLVGLVPSCHCAFLGISWVQNFFPWVFRGSKIFSRRYFVGPKFFSRGYFVGLKFFLLDVSWVQNFLVGPKFFLVSILWAYFFSFT